MKVKHVMVLSCLLLSTASVAKQDDKVMTKDKGNYVVNTTTLCTTKGFKGTTPLMVTIKKDKIVKVEALPNKETPRYFQMIKDKLFPKYEGLSLKKAASVDVVSGATYSSKAVMAHVKAAIDYHKKNK